MSKTETETTMAHITLLKAIRETKKVDFIDSAIEVLTHRYNITDVDKQRAHFLGVVSCHVDKSKLSEIKDDALVENVREDNIVSSDV